MPPKKDAKPAKKEGKAKSNAGGGGKAKKKKWSKAQHREKLDNKVLWEAGDIDKLMNSTPKWRVITVAVLSDRLHINGSLAREAIQYLSSQNLIREVTAGIYTRATKGKEDDKE